MIEFKMKMIYSTQLYEKFPIMPVIKVLKPLIARIQSRSKSCVFTAKNVIHTNIYKIKVIIHCNLHSCFFYKLCSGNSNGPLPSPLTGEQLGNLLMRPYACRKREGAWHTLLTQALQASVSTVQ